MTEQEDSIRGNSVRESSLYYDRMVGRLKSQIEICTKQKNVGLRGAGKERLLHATDISYFSKPAIKQFQSLLRTSERRVFKK